ncbi:MAG: MauE/DoxX family redox-associated membrane protein [Acidimicrobiia bacterium]
MNVLSGPLAIAAVLLVGGGLAKAQAPGNTARALQAVGLRASASVVRIGALLEVAVGLGALLAPSPVFIALVSLSYTAFSVFVVLALRAGTPMSSCGCFGKVDTPPSRVHIVIDGAVAIAAAVVAVAGTDVSLPTILPEQPLLGIPFSMLVGIGASLTFLAFTSLPQTLNAARRPA